MGSVPPPPQVPASAYDREYYLEGCLGSDEWRDSEGREPSGFYIGMLLRASLSDGDRLLDIGTGRGELVRVAAERGAEEAIGVDYSPDAIELAQQTLRAGDAGAAARVVLADARHIPVPDAHFDLVTMLDVVEHLTPAELEVTLGEGMRALRPGGRMFIHTAPNRFVYDVTYRLQRALRPSRRRTWPTEPRNKHELDLHVNEQTIPALRKTLRDAGFAEVKLSYGDWVHTEFVPEPRAKRIYHAFHRVPGLRRFGVIDIFAEATKP
jgi:ubiquinone/menaquinone biosynthesis C-methylase UbiE